MKFALMSYDYTNNLGNEIQSIAARQFLPKIDYHIDHEKLNLFKSKEKVKMIMNAWYLDCLSSWPPSDDIDPLLISMHFNTSVNDTREVILSDKSRDFFSTYGPVGCRDFATLKLLEDNDIDAYFSGCLTLTLTGEKKKQDPYIVVNVFKPQEIVKYLRTKTDVPIYDIYQLSTRSFDKKYILNQPDYYHITSFYSSDEKFFMAENLLELYENASCVITDRMHCALPSLALNTPVLFVDSAKFGLERLDGVTQLLRCATVEEYMDDYSIFDVENPPENPDDYLKLRKNLINTTKEFTGHMANSYLENDSQRLNKNIALLSKTSRKTRFYMQNVIKTVHSQQEEIERQNKIIEEQKRTIDELKNGSSSKLNPFKKFRK